MPCRDDHGKLALHWAAASGHADLVALLLGAAKAQKAAVEAAPEEADPALLGLVGKPVCDIQVGLPCQHLSKTHAWGPCSIQRYACMRPSCIPVAAACLPCLPALLEPHALPDSCPVKKGHAMRWAVLPCVRTMTSHQTGLNCQCP